MDENPDSFVRLCFRKGDPSGAGLPSFNASIRKNNGWFELMGGIPDVSLVQIDTDLISEDEASIYAKYLKKNTFFGPNAWYVNGDLNEAFDQTTSNKKLDMPNLIDYLHKKKKKIITYNIDEYWIDIGNASQLNQAKTEFTEVFS